MGSEKRSLKVLLLPWLAHGHVTPYLQLGRKLLARNFEVCLVSTPANFTSVRQKVPDSIRLAEIHLPSLPELPPHLHTTNGLPPHLMPALKRALYQASPSFLDILKVHGPDLVIYDFIHSWAPTTAATLGIPAVLFLTFSASTVSFFNHFFLSSPVEGSAFPFPIIHYRPHEEESMMKLLSSAEDTKDVDRFNECITNSCNFILIKTFREIEGKYIDYLPRCLGKNVVPVGPLLDYPLRDDGRVDGDPLMQWLDEKAEGSGVYVSFGTEYYLSREDMREISHGLELSGVNFIWVARFPLADDGKEALPHGFVERVAGRGLVVDWAPQMVILSHPSIAGFVSHCGWGSVVEAMEAGVPIIAMPMQIDQPLNARLVEELGVGVEAIRDGSGDLRGEEIAKVILRVVQGETGPELRKRARETRDLMRERAELYVDAAVQELCNLVV